MAGFNDHYGWYRKNPLAGKIHYGLNRFSMAGYIPRCGEESPGIGHETGKVTISAACGSFVAESRCGDLADQRWSFHRRLLCSWPYKRSLFRSNTLKALRKQNWEVGVWMVG